MFYNNAKIIILFFIMQVKTFDSSDIWSDAVALLPLILSKFCGQQYFEKEIRNAY